LDRGAHALSIAYLKAFLVALLGGSPMMFQAFANSAGGEYSDLGMSTTPLQRNYLEELRKIFFHQFTARSWLRLQEHLLELELPWQSRESDSKARFVERSLRETPDDEIIRIARWYVANHASTDEIDDSLEWLKSEGKQILSDITRREVLEAVEGRPLAGRVEIAKLLSLAGASLPRYHGFTSVVQDGSELYTENVSFAFYGQSSPRTPLSNKQFLKDCGFLDWVDSRAVRLLEALVHPSFREGADQAEWVNLLSPILKPDGYTFQQRETISGRALFQLVRKIEGVAGRPKNLIFASIGFKPELGFADAINNDVVVLEHAESCLIYDRNLSDSGLLWSDLVAWWAELNDLDPASPQTRKLLGTRLQSSLHYPHEKLLFDTYFKEYVPKLKERLPALIPQVYLHYDPKTLKELQGRKRIPRQRMDFLLLLEHGARIVLEIDGRQHYADESGKASPEKYAEMVRADRNLTLAGYDVYRFGVHDFPNKGAEGMIVDFFRRLFARHGIA